MLSFRNIYTIARYERKILLRSWFFRIFAILSLFIIGVFSAVNIFDKNPFMWGFRSLPSAVIYSNMFLLNIFQSIIAVFLATDFLKRDKRLNTSEVLFVRPMSNTEYVLGKSYGLFSVFVLLNFLVLLLTAIYMIASPEIPFQLGALVFYFLLLSVPTLIFVIGLSFAMMSVIRNQPVTFIILLGYIALVLFYLGDKTGYLFDYMAYVMPVSFSEIIGFTNFNGIIFQRVGYLVLGLAFISFTIAMLNRLPDKRMSQLVQFSLSIMLLLVSSAAFYKIYEQSGQSKANRKEYADSAARYFDKPVPLMEKASISVEHGAKMKAQSVMTFRNNTGEIIDTLYLSLNPGFKVEEVKQGASAIAFSKDNQVIEAILIKPLNNEKTTKVTVTYSGKPDFDISYLDAEDEDYFGYDRIITLRIDRKYGFYSNDYVLLSRENLWYPVPGVFYDPSRPAIFRQQFTEFDLTVSTREGLLPVAQGIRQTEDSLTYHFDIRDPLPQISLAIGNYVEKSTNIGGIDVKMAHIESHDYYKEHFSEIGDTINSLITEFLDDYERPIGMYYPYQTYTLVETPVQYASHAHSWTSTLEQTQPQLTFFPENGFNVQQADFASTYRRTERDSEHNNQGLTEKEIQVQVFSNFLRGVFSDESGGSRFDPDAGNQSNPYNIFANYFYFVNYITSEQCPVLNYAFESYLMKGEDDPRSMFMSRMSGLGDNEKASMMLKEKSLKQIIAEDDNQQEVNRVLQAKGSYLLTWMEKQINNAGFDQFMLDYLYNNSYREIKFKELSQTLSQEFDIDPGNFISEWYNTTSLPAFGLGGFDVFETIEDAQAVFVVRTKVSNYNETPGLVKFTFQTGGGRRDGFMPGQAPDPIERIYLIEGKQTQEIQMVLDEAPRSVIFNTMLSENIPASYMEFGLRVEEESNVTAEEYARTVDKPVDPSGEDGIVIDNIDDGFSTHDPSLDNPLRQFVESRKNKDSDTRFTAEGFGPPPATWSLIANSDYYGLIEHSAMIIRGGDGTKEATWQTILPEEAYYDIYVYLNKERRRGRRHRQNNSDGMYTYRVYHADGVEEITIQVEDFEDGWNSLGSYYIVLADTAKVVLANAGGADKVVADAVKWVVE
jgi:ABC-type transport system involved in multi-copper enzyme maturation permease subunit